MQPVSPHRPAATRFTLFSHCRQQLPVRHSHRLSVYARTTGIHHSRQGRAVAPLPHNEFAAAAREGCAVPPPGSGSRLLGEGADPEAGTSRAGRGLLRAAPPTPPRGAAAPSPGTAGCLHRGDGPRGAPLLPPYADVYSPQRKSPSRKTPRTPPNSERRAKKTCRCHPIASPHVAALGAAPLRAAADAETPPAAPGPPSSARHTQSSGEIKKETESRGDGASTTPVPRMHAAGAEPTYLLLLCGADGRQRGGEGGMPAEGAGRGERKRKENEA